MAKKTMTLKEMIEKELPLNRKERFFTGTVFPMIVCKDNFKYFDRFLSLIDGCGKLEILADPRSSNIEFYTEYSLLESVFTKRDKKRFRGLPRTKDTPDIMILINEEPKTLIAIEAKMYDVPDCFDLKKQMNKQKDHTDYLKEKLHVALAMQVALIPQQLNKRINKGSRRLMDSAYQVVTWEDVLEKYSLIGAYKGDYFLSLLQLALSSYDDLACHAWGTSKNCELKLSGKDIYDNYTKSDFTMKIMGRKGGFDRAEQDIITKEKWRTQIYETSSADSLPTDNWFHIEKFIERVEEHRKSQVTKRS